MQMSQGSCGQNCCFPALSGESHEYQYGIITEHLEDMHRAASKHPTVPTPPKVPDGSGGRSLHLLPTDANIVPEIFYHMNND